MMSLVLRGVVCCAGGSGEAGYGERGGGEKRVRSFRCI
jgi:hypothetical protein